MYCGIVVYTTKIAVKEGKSASSKSFKKFKTFCYGKKGYAEETVKETIKKLRYMDCHGVNLDNITKDDVYEFLAWKKTEQGASAANHYVKAINRWCEFKKLHYHFEKYKEYSKEPYLLSSDEVVAIINVYSKKTSTHKRNKLIIVILARTGIRVGELCNIRMRDIDWKNGTITIWGKGGGMKKPRTIPIDTNLLEGKKYPSIKNYVEHWRLSTDKEYLITTQNGRLTPHRVRQIVKYAAKQVGLPRVHPHLFRHYFATKSLRETNNIFWVSKYLGHENMETTARYLHLIKGDLRELIRNVKDPLLQKPRNSKSSGSLAKLTEETKMGPQGLIIFYR